MSKLKPIVLGTLFLIVVSCTTTQPAPPAAIQPVAKLALATVATKTHTTEPTSTIGPTSTETSSRVTTVVQEPTQTSTVALTPTAVSTATPTITKTPPPTITSTPLSPCSERIPEDQLLAFISPTYAISEVYEPENIVSLNEYLPYHITLGTPMRIKEIALDPLLKMVADMEAEGLQPRVVSAYRDAYEQTLAYEKWSNIYPNRVDQISARPGHSEHQLGTTVDFTSPELPALTGDPDLRFHPLFSETSEGVWLAENAHKYGFTLSYPEGSLEATGFHFEPWHFRYIGKGLATRLHQIGISFTEFQLINLPPPCSPDD